MIRKLIFLIAFVLVAAGVVAIGDLVEEIRACHAVAREHDSREFDIDENGCIVKFRGTWLPVEKLRMYEQEV